MSKGDRRPPQQNAPQITRFAIAPPLATQDTPPGIATNVVVTGGADVLVIEFFHISSATLARAFEGDQHSLPPNIERRGGAVTVRSEPIARVAVPFTLGCELVARLIETVGAGVPDVQGALVDMGLRASAAMAAVQKIGNIAVPGAAPPEPATEAPQEPGNG
jgi:hypothetical protein